MGKHWKRFMRGAHVLGDVFAAAVTLVAASGVVIVLIAPAVLALGNENLLWMASYVVYAAVWVYVEGWRKER